MSRKGYVQCYQLSSCPTVQEYHKKSTNTKYELTPELASLLRNALQLHVRKTFLSSRFQIISLQNQAVRARKSRKGSRGGTQRVSFDRLCPQNCNSASIIQAFCHDMTGFFFIFTITTILAFFFARPIHGIWAERRPPRTSSCWRLHWTEWLKKEGECFGQFWRGKWSLRNPSQFLSKANAMDVVVDLV